jgi:hypothetical protein
MRDGWLRKSVLPVFAAHLALFPQVSHHLLAKGR